MDCHNAAEAAGGVVYEGLTRESVAQRPELFEKVARKLHGRLMPPPGNPQPEQADVDAFVGWIEHSIDKSAPAHRAGHVPMQRMTRTEYAAAVKDLLDFMNGAGVIAPIADTNPALFLVAGGLYPCIGLVLSWVANNNGSDSKRGAGFILMNFVGQCGPLVGTHIFPKSEAPHYKKGFYISFAFCCFAATLALCQIAWLKHLNAALDRQYGPVRENVDAEDEIGEETDDSENFRFIL